MEQSITEREHRLLKRASNHDIAAQKLSVKDLEALVRLSELGYVKRWSSKETENNIDYARKILDEKTEEESYRRYKHRCYRYLVLKALLSFGLGLLLMCLLKL